MKRDAVFYSSIIMAFSAGFVDTSTFTVADGLFSAHITAVILTRKIDSIYKHLLLYRTLTDDCRIIRLYFKTKPYRNRFYLSFDADADCIFDGNSEYRQPIIPCFYFRFNHCNDGKCHQSDIRFFLLHLYAAHFRKVD